MLILFLLLARRNFYGRLAERKNGQMLKKRSYFQRRECLNLENCIGTNQSPPCFHVQEIFVVRMRRLEPRPLGGFLCLLSIAALRRPRRETWFTEKSRPSWVRWHPLKKFLILKEVSATTVGPLLWARLSDCYKLLEAFKTQFVFYSKKMEVLENLAFHSKSSIA